MKTLVTGGVRSGKSTYAEGLLVDATYLATGAPRDDADWQERVRLHQERRPASWRTLETLEVPTALDAATGAVLLDDVGNWLSRTLDALDAWGDETPRPGWQAAYRDTSEALVDAIANYEDDLVLVTNEGGTVSIQQEDALWGVFLLFILSKSKEAILCQCNKTIFLNGILIRFKKQI